MKLKKTIFTLLGIVLGAVSTSACTVAQAEHPSEAEVEVMILGTFHFTAGGSDVVNTRVQDYLAPKSQKNQAIA